MEVHRDTLLAQEYKKCTFPSKTGARLFSQWQYHIL